MGRVVKRDTLRKGQRLINYLYRKKRVLDGLYITDINTKKSYIADNAGSYISSMSDKEFEEAIEYNG